MQSFQSLPFDQPLSAQQFNQLQDLLQQIAQEVGALVLTEKLLPCSVRFSFTNEEFETTQFILVAAESFSALVYGKPEPRTLGESAIDRFPTYRINLTFAPDAIATFLDRFCVAPLDSALLSIVEQVRSVLRPNNADLQSQFTLRLIGLLTRSSTNSGTPLTAMPTYGSQLAETTLRQQIQQERLLNQVTAQIRQSLELPVILQTAVEQVRQVLQVDRLVIYCLDLDTLNPVAQPNSSLGSTTDDTLLESFLPDDFDQKGTVIYEAKISESTPSVLAFSEAHCFVNASNPDNLRDRNLAIAVPDVEIKYAAAPCLLKFLRQAKIRAKLVAPILIRHRLWGLLIAHQCTHPRQWQESEQRFLQQIAEHLSIAISQAQLYTELQQQKHTLEQRVAKRTQELHDVMQAAQAANRSKSEFLAAVSHELRTPLTCIIGMSATLQRWTTDSLNERQRNFLQTIHDSGEYLLTLINDILDLSQVEAGKMLLTVSEFSLSRLSQQSLKAFEGEATLSEITLELDLQVNPQFDRFVADPRRIQQILFNLLDNAIKFTPTGGKVTLRVLAEENLAIFQVKDQGIGIPEHQVPLLFQKFHQLNAGYQRQYRGTGLGLALTKQLVDLHGGWIDVESTAGVGSVFTVRLPPQPLHDRQQIPKTRSLTVPSPVKGRIVLIEHREETANLICDVLTAAGYQIIWMIEGASAIEQIEVLRPVVIIANVYLPDIDGHILIQQLRRNPATKSLKIIALTPTGIEQSNLNATAPMVQSAPVMPASTPSSSAREEWRTVGADAFLMQPIRPDRLLQTVLTLTER